MADDKTPIRDINGHLVVDQEARDQAAQNAERIDALSEEIESIKEGGSNLVEKVLFEEPEMVFSPLDDTGLYMGMRADPGFQFAEGKTYIVTVDGVAREYVASTLDGMDVVAVGNASFMNVEGGSFEDTGDPIMAITPSTEQLSMFTNEPGEMHSVKVSMMVEKSSGGTMRVDITMDADGNATASKTYKEIAEALAAGVMPYCVAYGIVLQLTKSDAIASTSTYAVFYSHSFAAIVEDPDFGICYMGLKIKAGNNVSTTKVILNTSELS